jgi:adenylate cyclase
MARRLAAILASDVAGYSRLMEEDEAGTLAVLKAHHTELIAPQIDRHHGRIVKLMGDGALVEFASVVEAVNCAVAIQRGMAERNLGLPENRRMDLRIGVHLGDVIVDDQDIYGDGVNVAARLESIADPGGICLSQQAYDQVDTKIDLPVEDLGPREFKNIARLIHAYRLLLGSPGGSPRDAAAEVALPPNKPSIAVLPFDNMSGDPDQEYFADGLTEDIITALSSWRWFPVIARHSTFAYKRTTKPLLEIAQELRARYVLEGSVRKLGERVRITVQLIDAMTDHHIWAKRYDRDIRDIFALQDEITASVVVSIEPELGRAERKRAMHKRVENLDAWDLTLRAQAHVFQFTKNDNMLAFDFLKKALELEPDSAYAMSMLALCHYKDAILGFSSDRDGSLVAARKAAERAVALDDRDWLAQGVLGITLVWTERAFERALEHEEEAIALNPSSTWGRAFLSCVLEFGGSPDRAIPELHTALALDPHSPLATFIYSDLAICYFLLRSFDDAISNAKRAIDISPANVRARQRLVASLAQAGRIDEARASYGELIRRQPGFSIAYIDQTYPFKFPEDRALFVEGLHAAGLPR